MKKFYNFINTDNESSLYIYGDIGSWEEFGEISANGFKQELDLVEDKDLTVYISSFGGEVTEGLAIGNMLKRRKQKTKCVVDSFACSIASVIACCCSEVEMYGSSMLMVHNALCGAVGNATELRKVADDLDRISNSLKEVYLEKSKGRLTIDKITELMDGESWLSAKECVEYGLCDRIITGELKAVAKADSKLLNTYKNVPENLLTIEDKSKELELINKEIENNIDIDLELLKMSLSIK